MPTKLKITRVNDLLRSRTYKYLSSHVKKKLKAENSISYNAKYCSRSLHDT